jgi:5-methylthioadenosine/S-adenosylhomocysteine deaminase
MSTLLVEDGLVVTQNANRDLVEGDVLVEDGEVAAIGPDAGDGADPDRVVAAEGCAVLPGLVNAHTHVAMTLFRGFGDDMPLEDWLEERIWPAEAHLDADRTVAGTRLGLAEMAASGTTTFADMYFFESEMAGAVEAAGLRGVMGFSFLDHPTPEMGPDEMVPEARTFLKEWSDHDRVTPSLAPHATYTCGPGTLEDVRSLSGEHPDVPVQTHCSETRDEVYDVESEHGRRPVAQLEEHGLLDEGTVLAHCGWITKGEARSIGEAGAGVVHCPTANMKLATGGYTPIPELVEAGADVALGTDGPGSNNTLDMLDTMKDAALVHKHHRWDATVLPAQEVLDMATLGGARVLGLADQIGSIEEGKAGDLVLVDLDRPALQPLHDVVSTLVYAAQGRDVKATVVGGDVVYEDGTVETLDVEAVQEEAREAAFAIAERVADEQAGEEDEAEADDEP